MRLDLPLNINGVGKYKPNEGAWQLPREHYKNANYFFRHPQVKAA